MFDAQCFELVEENGGKFDARLVPTATRRAGIGLHLRHRIEHAQVLHPDDLLRFAELGVIPSMQPIHCTQDIVLADRHWGERSRLAYAWSSLQSSGAVLAFGSDAPVETPDIMQGIYAAVTRRRADGYPGADGWYPEECVSVAEAVYAYTLGAAYAGGEEAIKGLSLIHISEPTRPY